MKEFIIYLDNGMKDEYYGKTPIENQAKGIARGLRKKGYKVRVKYENTFGQLVSANI